MTQNFQINLGVPVLNGGQYLLRLVESIDVPVNLYVVANRLGELDQSVGDALKQIEAGLNPLVQVVVDKIDGNLGVAGSWNKILDHFQDRVLICNFDIQFGASVIEEAWRWMMDNEGVTLGCMHAASCFIVQPDFIQKAGYYDENIYPAYNEDSEMGQRWKLGRFVTKNIPDMGLRVLHGDEAGGKKASCTLKMADSALRQFIAECGDLNRKYLLAKWGKELVKGGLREFEAPFNKSESDYRRWELDLELRQQRLGLLRKIMGVEVAQTMHRTHG
jgi:hypothetical protein